jgi:transcription elongation GreA/GreB family factor
MMTAARITSAMRRSLELRLEELEARIAALDIEGNGHDSVEGSALLLRLRGERNRVLDAVRDAKLIDDEPFDLHALEVGDLVTVRDDDGEVGRYVLVDEGVGTRARGDWVSVGSPLGRAILGRSRGDKVQVESPEGRLSYVIVHFERASEGSVANAGRSESDSNAEFLSFTSR